MTSTLTLQLAEASSDAVHASELAPASLGLERGNVSVELLEHGGLGHLLDEDALLHLCPRHAHARRRARLGHQQQRAVWLARGGFRGRRPRANVIRLLLVEVSIATRAREEAEEHAVIYVLDRHRRRQLLAGAEEEASPLA